MFQRKISATLLASASLLVGSNFIEPAIAQQQQLAPVQTRSEFDSRLKGRQMPQPTPAPPPKEGELKCEVAMQRLLQASDYGPSLSGLKPGVQMLSFKVSDVKQSMSIATEAISKIPEASPEQKKLIDQANQLRRPFDEAQEKYLQARDQFELLRAERVTVENLVSRPGELTVTLGELSGKIAAASALAHSTNDIVEQKQKVYLDFVEKNGLIHAETAPGQYGLKPKNSLKQNMLDTVSVGEVADAAKRIAYLSETIGESGLPIPFDEIVVVRGQSLADRKAVIDQFNGLLPDRQEIERLVRSNRDLEDFVASTSLSSASRDEIQRIIKRNQQRLKKLEEKNPIQAMEELRAKLAIDRPLTVLKSNGVIIGAIADGERRVGSLEPVTNKSRGFWCRDAKTVSGGWHHTRGMLSIEKCQRDAVNGFVDSSCRSAMNFNYYGTAGPPPPAKSPSQAPGVTR